MEFIEEEGGVYYSNVEFMLNVKWEMCDSKVGINMLLWNLIFKGEAYGVKFGILIFNVFLKSSFSQYTFKNYYMYINI